MVTVTPHHVRPGRGVELGLLVLALALGVGAYALAGLALVMLPLVPGLGAVINGARIWVRLGGMSLQPAEFGKIALAVFFAGYLVTHRDTLALAGPKILGLHLPRVRDLGPILVVWAGSLAVLVV